MIPADKNQAKAFMASYRRRKEGVKKKTRELSVLCDISACAICFGPDGKVDTWPENPTELKSMIDMLSERWGIEWNKNGSSNRHSLLDGVSEDSMRKFLAKIELKIEGLKNRAEFLKQKNAQNGEEIFGSHGNPQPLQSLDPYNYLHPSSQNLEFASDFGMSFEDDQSLVGKNINLEDLFSTSRFDKNESFDKYNQPVAARNMERVCDAAPAAAAAAADYQPVQEWEFGPMLKEPNNNNICWFGNQQFNETSEFCDCISPIHEVLLQPFK